jgi:hypothetical protein
LNILGISGKEEGHAKLATGILGSIREGNRIKHSKKYLHLYPSKVLVSARKGLVYHREEMISQNDDLGQNKLIEGKNRLCILNV